jgi:hypothetical protein
VINIMQQYEEIAMVNPRLAVALLRSNPQLPQVYSLQVTFSSGATDVPVSAQIDSPVTEDFWVYKVEYQVQQPKAYIGNLFRAQQVYYNAQNPDIAASFTISGGVGLPWLFSSSALPIEGLATPMTGTGGEGRYGCCSNFVMFFPQTLRGTFWLTREYQNTNVDPDQAGEIPTILTVTLTGQTLGCKNYGGLSIKQAQEILRSEYDVQTPAIQGA